MISKLALALVAMPMVAEARLKAGISLADAPATLSKASQHRRTQGFNGTNDHISYFDVEGDGTLSSTLWDVAHTASLLSQGIYFDTDIDLDILGISDQLALSRSYSFDESQKRPAPHMVSYMQHNGVPYVMGTFRGREVSTFDFVDYISQTWIIVVCAVGIIATGIVGLVTCILTVTISMFEKLEKVEKQVKKLCRKVRKSPFNYPFNITTGEHDAGSTCVMSNELMDGYEAYDDFTLIKEWLQYCKEDNNGPCQLILTGHSNGGVYAHAAAASLKTYLDEYYSDIYNATDATFHPYVFMFGSPPAFSATTARGECSYLDSERVFNFMNIDPKESVYDISVQMGRERGATHLGNQIMLNKDPRRVKRYLPDDDSFDVGSAECDINIQGDKSLARLYAHVADEYSDRIAKLADKNSVAEDGFAFGKGCKRDSECQYGYYCREKDATCWYAFTEEVGYRCDRDVQCKQFENSTAVSCWKQRGDNHRKCWYDDEKKTRGLSCDEDEQCMDGLICFKDSDEGSSKECLPENSLSEGEKCNRNLECNTTMACFRWYDAAKDEFESNHKCWSTDDLQVEGDPCKEDNQCEGDLTCWEPFGESTTGCWSDAEKLQEGDECSKDVNCDLGLECKKKYGEDVKGCWLATGGWLSADDKCNHNIECKYSMVCLDDKCDAPLGLGEKCKENEECDGEYVCFKGFDSDGGRDDDKTCHETYQTRADVCESDDHCETGLTCLKKYNDDEKACWGDADKQGRGGACEKNEHCASGYECKKKPGASQKRCFVVGDHWLENGDTCEKDKQCPSDDICVKRYGVSRKQCTSESELQGTDTQCDNTDQCQRRHVCYKDDESDDKLCLKEYLDPLAKCKYSFQCDNRAEYSCFKSYGASTKRCRDDSYKVSHGNKCDEDHHCGEHDGEQMTCWRAWDDVKQDRDGNKKCWTTEKKQAEHQRCEDDEHCASGLVCKKKYGQDKKECVQSSGAWLEYGDKCQTDSECQGGYTCFNKKGDGTDSKFCYGDSDKLERNEECNYDVQCKSGLECWSIPGKGKKCRRDSDLLGLDAECNDQRSCGTSNTRDLTCKKKDGENKSRCYYSDYPWLEQGDRCGIDAECDGMPCYQLPGDSNKKCNPLRNRGETCRSDANCASSRLCREKKGQNNKKCWNNGDLEGEGERCGSSDVCQTGFPYCCKKGRDNNKKCWSSSC